MSNFDYFRQYQAEQRRIQEKIRDEENEIHRGHLVMIEQMIDDKIKSAVPLYIQEFNEKQKVDVEAYFNGKPATDANIVKGVRDMVAKALKRMGKGKCFLESQQCSGFDIGISRAANTCRYAAEQIGEATR